VLLADLLAARSLAWHSSSIRRPCL
jgi:hypothetical protein